MVFLVWLHVLAAVSWIGGSIFLSVVLVPVLRREPFASQKTALIRTTALRFVQSSGAQSPYSCSLARCCCINEGSR